MSNVNCSWIRRSFLGLIFIAATVFCGPMRGQSAPSVHVGGVEITGVPDDWTHRHVVFANPGTEQDAIQSGHYAQWQKIVNDPRYVIQQIKRNLPVQGPAAVDADYRARWISEATGAHSPSEPSEIPAPGFGFGPHNGRPVTPFKRPIGWPGIQRDWSMTSGGAGGLLPSHFPAKYGFLPTAGSKTQESCSDFIVFPTGITGGATQATLVAYNNIYKSPTCAGNIPSILLSINTGGLANTSPILSLDGTQVAYVQNPASSSISVTTTNGSTAFVVTTGTISAADVGLTVKGVGIPLYDTIATFTDSTHGNLATAATASGTGVALTITGGAQLVLLKLASGGTSVSMPDSPGATSNALYRACTAPCYTTFTFHADTTGGNSPADSISAPYYEYNDITDGNPDILFVGDDLGYVHEFTGVFSGATPAETVATGTNPWPVSVANGTQDGTFTTAALNSPVFDFASGYVFVGDSSGYLHEFKPATTGTVTSTGHLAYETAAAMDSVVVDNTSGTDYVYQFVGYSDDTGHNRPSYINRFPATTAFTGTNDFGTGVYYTNGSTSARPAGTSTLQLAGTFDNAYFTGGGTTGNIYTCAGGVLYQIPIATITTPTVNTFNTPTSAAANCSSVTEFYAGATDWIFMSDAANGIASGGSTCTGACVLNYNVTTSTNTTGTPTAGLNETGGTSGIVIDNAAAGGGSEIYFTTLGSQSCTGQNGTGPIGSGSGSCAVQASQSGLQ